MALDSLAVQTGIDRSRMDVLVVDNGSTDNTLEVVEQYRPRLPFDLSTASEPHQGISFARNKSLEAARGDIIAYIDDDAIAAPDWAAQHLRAYETDPDVRGAMGRIFPVWEAERPDWLDPLLESYLTVCDYGDEPFDLAGTTHAPVGANMSLSRTAMIEAGGFDVRFGFGGLEKIPGEENEIAQRIWAKGWKLVYWPAASVQHGVPADRMTVKWFKKRVFDQGRCEYLFDAEHSGAGKITRRVLVGGLVCGPALVAAACVDVLTGNRARAARRACVPWATLGYIRELAVRRGRTAHASSARDKEVPA